MIRTRVTLRTHTSTASCNACIRGRRSPRVHGGCSSDVQERDAGASLGRSRFSHTVRSQRGAARRGTNRLRVGERPDERRRNVAEWRTEPFSRSHEAAPCATTATTSDNIRARYTFLVVGRFRSLRGKKCRRLEIKFSIGNFGNDC